MFSANKALVWRRCAWWAIAMGPVLPNESLGTRQSGWMLVARSIGVDRNRFRLFWPNKAACDAHGAKQMERHVMVYPTRSCQASKAPSVGRVAPMASTGHDFVISANKALVWRRCARWAVAMGPVTLDACMAY